MTDTAVLPTLEAEERLLWRERQQAIAHADDCLMVYRGALRQAKLANEAWLNAFRRLGGAS
jgi:hypothetical protein